MKVKFPWRNSFRGFKRDTGSSHRSMAVYGDPDIVFVYFQKGEGFVAHHMPPEGPTESMKGFSTMTEAMRESDRVWPVRMVN